MDAYRFMVDLAACFEPGQVRVAWSSEVPPADPALEAMIARTWDDCVREARAGGIDLFNGRLARYLRHRVDNGILRIEVGPTDYAAFLGTNYHNPHRAAEFGWEHYSNPLGTSATVITSDGWLLYGRRSRYVACHAGYVHTFGGGLEADECEPIGHCDIFDSILRELEEELSLAGEDIERAICVGLIRDAIVRQPELIFDVHVRPSREQLEKRLEASPSAQEHDAIVAVRDEPETAVPFILAHRPIAPVAVGALLLHGRRRFGEAWYEAAMVALQGPSDAC
jgi:hypothetical protein